MGRHLLRCLILVLVLNAGYACRAEVFVLANGGRISGELVNRQESPRKQYVVKVAGEGQITLAASQVEQVLKRRSEEDEYERIRPAYPDTIEGQWALAEWCRQKHLPLERETHLKRMIELDPNQIDARRALGYVQVDGQWTTQDELMIERGYKLYKNHWLLPQQIELLESKAKLENARQEWFQNIKRWRGWLGTDRDSQARENFGNITDPMAVKALLVNLRDDASIPARLIYVEALAKINSPDAAMGLAVAAIEDRAEEVRQTCLDRLQTEKRPDVVTYFVSKLRAKDNPTVNLAGIALGRMKDPSSIGPLIDALVTTHKFKIPKAGGDGAMSTTFGNGPGGKGGGMSMGGGPTIISKQFANQPVLDALAAITGQNFTFDQSAWRRWYAAQKKTETIDPRRD
ncbi:MAG: HEAT repeat domain-containing protein [Thermoguttaceae bacterium]